MKKGQFVSVVIPAHNEEKYIGECLESLKNQDYPPELYEVIVVDNNSTDQTRDIALSFKTKLLQKKTGPVGSVRNLGATSSKGEIIAFLDSDCIAPNDWISSGVKLLDQNPNSVFGGGYELRDSPFWIEKYWLLEGKNSSSLPNDLLGGSIFIRKETFLEAGMFDETITSGEDSKLSETLRLSNKDVCLKRTLNVIHLGNPTDSKTFFKRQIWHSENYVKDIKTSLRDKTFYLVLVFYFSLIASFLHVISNNSTQAISYLAIALLTPFILSTKRIFRSGTLLRSPKEIVLIYYLDLLYLLARTIGLTKSLLRQLQLV